MIDLRNANFEDRELRCVECDREFVFSRGEQYFFASKRFPDPRRCPECREIRKRTVAPPEVLNGQ